MTTIKLYNTKTRQKEAFTPLNPDDVRMYVCGPTVYDRAHIGNARPVIVFDVLYRLLRQVYGKDHVTYARNFTDVDDKINAKAAQTGRTIRDITDETIAWYLEDMGALGNLKPDEMPRATEYIEEMITMTAGLITAGHAYAADGHVLFAVDSYEHYGSLSGRSVDDMIAGARVEVAPYKRNPMDFVLWKPSAEDQPGWDSPWGYGRPGWHIECSAMADALFGKRFDIHGGGLDLAFPHHENEKAQSCACGSEDDFAQVWMHNEMLQVEGKKMSKSLGNFFSVRELIEQGYSGEVIRFVFLSTHYRKPMDWTVAKASQFQNELHKWSSWMMNFKNTTTGPSSNLIACLADDLNTAKAITVLRDAFKAGQYEQLAADCKFLGIWDGHSPSEISGLYAHDTDLNREIADLIQLQLIKLDKARRSKDFATADGIRDSLKAAGIMIKSGANGTVYERTENFDPAKLKALK